MSEKSIDSIQRSHATVSSNSLSKILRLVTTHRWMQPKSEGLASLFSECSSDEEVDLVTHLLSNFRYFDSYDLNDALESSIPTIESRWNLSPHNSVFTTLARDNNLDSGSLFLGAARNRLQNEEWASSNFVHLFYGIDFGVESWIEKIVLCDDFVGTGRTLERKTRALRNKLVQSNSNVKQIFFFGLACMNSAKPKIAMSVDDYFVCEFLQKGISDHFDGDKLAKSLEASDRLESKLAQQRRVAKMSRGYAQSQSLYNLADSNIPNNVFPIFWWPKLEVDLPRKTLFKRVAK